MDFESLLEEGFSQERAKEILQKYSKLTQERQKQREKEQHVELFPRQVYDYERNPYAYYEEMMGAPNGYLSDFNY